MEGRWDKLADACAGPDGARLDGDELTLPDGVSLLFGGDAVDRGPAGRRVLAALLRARRRYGDRVVWLAGNRDLNKLRLFRELQGQPPAKAPEDLRGAALLRWIFERTMGAREAFGHRAAELAAAGTAHDDRAVVDSFVEDVGPGGLLIEWLARAKLAHRVGRTLFVHGGVSDASLGAVPGCPRVDGVDAWVDALNGFLGEQVATFVQGRDAGDAEAWAPLIRYQAPVPGTHVNDGSVVYGRTADENNHPRMVSAEVRSRLMAAGVDRLVVGHTPVGCVPAAVRSDGFTLVMADNSYGRVERGVRVTVTEEAVAWSGTCRVDDGATVEVAARIGDDVDPIGFETPTGHLVKARVGDGWLVFRALPERRVEERVAPVGPLRDRPV